MGAAGRERVPGPGDEADGGGTNTCGRALRERCGSYLQLRTESERPGRDSDDNHISGLVTTVHPELAGVRALT